MNYEVPKDAEDYVHRIGRTAALALWFSHYLDRFLLDVNGFADIGKLIERSIEKPALPEENLDLARNTTRASAEGKADMDVLAVEINASTVKRVVRKNDRSIQNGRSGKRVEEELEIQAEVPFQADHFNRSSMEEIVFPSNCSTLTLT